MKEKIGMYSVIPANHKCRNCEYQADDRKLRCRWRVGKMSKESYAVADWSSDLETCSIPNRFASGGSDRVVHVSLVAMTIVNTLSQDFSAATAPKRARKTMFFLLEIGHSAGHEWSNDIMNKSAIHPLVRTNFPGFLFLALWPRCVWQGFGTRDRLTCEDLCRNTRLCTPRDQSKERKHDSVSLFLEWRGPCLVRHVVLE